ncbi:MAG: hypothetical protein HY303_13380, partial [Candidatus Wallbacteria bacterium]|nr:hypothetical protein [Candidatus Wallbacteria bacterium]
DTWELGPEPDSGASTVQLTAALQFAGNAAGYKAAPRPANPTTLACGETAVLTFAVEVTGASSPGPRTVTAVVAGKDANSGAAASVANTAAATWTIVPGPARLAVRSVAAAPVKVSRGQTVSPVSVVVANTGETAARVWSSGLVFGAGSSGYSVTPVSVETTLAAAATATFTYAVTVRETAPLGATAIDATVSAADVATGSPAGDSSADVTDTWLVQTPAALTLAPLSCHATVLRGTAFRATASLTNQGQAKAFPVDLTLSWGLPGLRVTPVGVPPVELDGGQSAAWSFDVSMPLTSALAPVGGNVTAIGTDANSGLVLHATTIGTVLPANHSPVALLATPAPAAFAAGVQLDASASYDGPAPDRSEGDPLSYRWAIAARPAGSSATASAFSVNATTGAARPLFRPDVPGSYRLSLVVSDGTDSSASAVVDALLENTAPVARAVASAPVPAGETVVLDGRSSFDAETPTSLIYRWSFASVPAGSLLTDGNIVPNASALAGRASFRTDRKGVYAIGLLVSDGFLDSAPAPVTVTATNRPPVASIAAPGEGLCFQSLTLAATGSSDPDGDALTYDWSFTSLPAGSALTTASMTPNGSASAATTAFVPDRPGTFAIALVARDAEAASPPAHWSIQVQPALPEAHAGADVTARVTQTVTLDGSASVSPGNQPMTYRWRFVSVPPNSRVTTASLSSNDATRAATTSFRPDRKGLYRLSLVVVTQQGASPPDRVDATAVNSGPAARTGADQTVALRRPVTLSGAGSSDPDAEDTLSFSWSLRSVPSGSRLSTSALVPNSSPGSAHTSFVPDVPGSYEVGLVVDDGIEPSARSLTRITAVNARPIAACSASGPAAVTQPVELDGSSSSDPDPDTALVYHWDLASRPAGSQLTTASLAPNDSASASLSRFQPDRKGLYVVRLIVSDGIASSVPATALVDAGNSPPAASLALVTVSPQANRDVVLDASQSSDPDLQDALSYGWRLSSRPQGSALQEISIAPLNPNQPWRARFVPDRAGSYSVRLIVSDATASTASERTVAVLPQPNPPPVATIRAQSLAGGPQVLQLDGRGSRPGATTRPIAAYRWRLAAAPAEARTLASSSATVSYDARAAGSYTFELTVTDISGLSGSVRVGASVTNVTPTAQAGPDSELLLYRPGLPPELGTTTTVRLNGRRSADANGTPLVYTWRVVLAPDKSVAQAAETTLAAIDDAHSAAPRISFRTDLVAESGGRFRLAAAGGYWVRLTVSDGEREEADEVAITALDPAALLSWADAGIETFDRVQFLPGGGIAPTVPDPTIVPALDASGNARNLRAHIRLDGHESADPTGLPLKYRWSVALDGEGRPLVPAGSAPPILSGADTATPSFVPAAEGMYTFELIVDNGRHSSWPDRVRVTIGSTNLSPRADIVAEDLETLQRVTPRDALTAFTLGHRIVLRGDGSSDPDPGDGAALLYSWTQEAGLRSELGPSTTTGVVSFVPAEPGRYAFSLVVRDPQARESQPEAIDFLVMPEGRPRPQIALTATAPGVSTTGQSMPEQQQDDSPRSLRVKAPVTVTLEARVSGLLPGERSDILWRQLAGPTVALSNVGDRNTVAEASVTTFSPTTSRVHVFEASLEPLDDSGQGTGLRVARRIAVLVDTATSRVPIAIA